jgi:hypothetical protein
MTRSSIRYGALGAVLLLLTACTGTDELAETSFPFTVKLEAVGNPTPSGNYDCIYFLQVTDFLIRPVDPATVDAIGPNGVRVLTSDTADRLRVSFLGRDCPSEDVDHQPIPPVVLPSGRYEIVSLVMDEITLITTASSTFQSCPIGFQFGDFDPPVIVRVGSDQPNSLIVRLDVASLEADMADFSCDTPLEHLTFIY